MNRWNRILVNNIARSSLVPTKIRYYIYRKCQLDIHTSILFPGIYFQSEKVHIGYGSWVNCDCYFDNHASIFIGNHVGIGMDVLLCTSTHELGNTDRRASRTDIRLPIVIEDGCWIGARATILPGVTIGKGCVVAAGSIVNKSCEPNGVYAGNPARRIKELDPLQVASAV